MSPDWLEAFGTWFSGLLVAGSLIFIWVQTRHSREQALGARQSTYHNLYLMWFEVDMLFTRHPDLRRFFYEKGVVADVPSEKKHVVDAIFQMILDCFDNVYHQRELMPEDTFTSWSEFMREMHSESECLKEFLSNNIRWYPVSFVSHISGGTGQTRA